MAIVKHRDITIKTVGMNPATFTFISNKDEFEAIMEMPCGLQKIKFEFEDVITWYFQKKV